MIAARMQGVRKNFGRKEALKDVSMEVKQGSICGLLGPNGSGKTTAMKVLSSLVRCDAGEAEVRGKFRALIEAPHFYGQMSGRENLEYFSAMAQGQKGETDSIIRMLGMEEYADRKAGRYSLGMKQRLGIACMLVGSPTFLILDEPLNGLDPLAITQMRELFVRMRQTQGTAFLISSHILSEMQLICDEVYLLRAGETVAHVDVQAENSNHVILFLEPADCDAAAALLGGCVRKKSGTEMEICGSEPIHETIRRLVRSDVRIVGVRQAQTDLEQLYREYFSEEVTGCSRQS